MFINHPGEVEVEVGSEKVSRVGVSVIDNRLEYFIVYGATPLEVMLLFLNDIELEQFFEDFGKIYSYDGSACVRICYISSFTYQMSYFVLSVSSQVGLSVFGYRPPS